MKILTWTILAASLAFPALSADKSAHNAAQNDTRTVVEFPPEIKEAMLERMRRNLLDIHRIQAALANKEYGSAADVAEFSLGLSSLGTHNARQAPYMPPAMQHLGMEMHAASSRVALAAQEGDALQALDKLSQVTAVCVGCHATYRAK